MIGHTKIGKNAKQKLLGTERNQSLIFDMFCH